MIPRDELQVPAEVLSPDPLRDHQLPRGHHVPGVEAQRLLEVSLACAPVPLGDGIPSHEELPDRLAVAGIGTGWL